MPPPRASEDIADRLGRDGCATRFLAHDHGLDAVTAGFDCDRRRPRPAGFSGRAPSFGCSYVLRGGGWLIDRRRARHRLEAGSMYLLLPDAEQRLEHDDGYATCYVCFNVDLYGRLRAAGLLPIEPQVGHGALDRRIVDRFVRLHDALRAATAGPPRRLLLQALELIDDLRWRSARTEEREALEPARRRLAERLDQPLSLPALAEDLGLDYDDFRRRFRRAFGAAPKEYRIRRRIEAACALLRDRPIERVARDLGYCDAFAFSKQFKRYMGVPPRRYRERPG